MNRRPNILITLADDQRHSLLGFRNLEPVRTPHLDRLAERGTCFTRAYIPGSTHGAVCAPSRAQLHTGRSLFHTSDSMDLPDPRSGLHRSPTPETLPTLGAHLRHQGYHTFATGKWHNGEASFERSFKHARSVFFGGMSSHYAVPTRNFEPDTSAEPRSGDMNGHSTDLFSQAAVDFLDSRSANDEEPFFLYCAFTAPHDPRETVWRWLRQYAPAQLPLPPNFLPMHPFENNWMHVRDEFLAEFPRTPEEILHHLADYYAITSHLDEGIGRIHAALVENGLSENTIVVHSADHGLALGNHGLMGKQSLYDHSVRVPLLIAGPGIPKSHEDDRLCYMQDLFPTLLDAADVTIPAECDFRNLFESEKRSGLGGAFANEMRSFRDQSHKLIRTHAAGQSHTQLFDLNQDPHEIHNLAELLPQKVTELDTELNTWQAQFDDPLLS